MELANVGTYLAKVKKPAPISCFWVLLPMLLSLTSCYRESSDESRVFRYNESANLSSLDPAFARTLEPMWVVDQLFDGLVELDEDLRVQPLIARQYELDSTGLVWTFILREGVRFHSAKGHCFPRDGYGSNHLAVKISTVFGIDEYGLCQHCPA